MDENDQLKKEINNLNENDQLKKEINNLNENIKLLKKKLGKFKSRKYNPTLSAELADRRKKIRGEINKLSEKLKDAYQTQKEFLAQNKIKE